MKPRPTVNITPVNKDYILLLPPHPESTKWFPPPSYFDSGAQGLNEHCIGTHVSEESPVSTSLCHSPDPLEEHLARLKHWPNPTASQPRAASESTLIHTMISIGEVMTRLSTDNRVILHNSSSITNPTLFYLQVLESRGKFRLIPDRVFFEIMVELFIVKVFR